MGQIGHLGPVWLKNMQCYISWFALSIFFETLPLYDGALRCTKVRSVSILKKVSISGKQVIWTRIGPKIMQPFVSILADFLKYCHMIGHNRKTKVIINFPKKSSLGQMCRLSQYDPKLCNHISHDLLL